MSEYNPPFKITNKVLSYVASISEKIGKVSAITNLESKPHLRRNNRIKYSLLGTYKKRDNLFRLSLISFTY